MSRMYESVRSPPVRSWKHGGASVAHLGSVGRSSINLLTQSTPTTILSYAMGVIYTLVTIIRPDQLGYCQLMTPGFTM